MLVTLSSLQPFVCHGLKQAQQFSDTVGAEDPQHQRRATADVPRRVPAQHRATAPVSPVVSHGIMMGTASPASTTSMTEGGDTRHGREGTWPCRTRATGLWENVMDAHGLSGFHTGHPAARRTRACRACATGPLLRVCPHLHTPSATPAGPPDRLDRGGVVRQQHHRPRRRIARERGHEIAISSAPCHRRLRAGRDVGIGNHGSPACWGAPADPCHAYPSVHQACLPVPIY